MQQSSGYTIVSFRDTMSPVSDGFGSYSYDYEGTIPPVDCPVSSCATPGISTNANQVEVVGRLENLSYEALDLPDDVIGQGLITARLHVSEVLRGSVSERVITIKYFDHTYLSEKNPVKFKLSRSQDGVYVVCTPKGATGFNC